jgi:hypothetical protein
MPHLARMRVEKRRELRRDKAGEGFHQCQPRHFAKVRAAPARGRPVVERIGHGAGQLDECRVRWKIEAKALQRRQPARRARGDRQVGKQPEGVGERRILRRPAKRRLGRMCGRARDVLSRRAVADEVDNLRPAPRLRQCPQANMTHDILPDREGGGEP